MNAPLRSSDFIFGEDVLGTERDATTGLITAQTGDVIDQQAVGAISEVWFPQGFCARPKKAEPGTAAAQCIGFRTGSNDVLFGMRDARSKALYGSLDDGETCVYASDGQARLLLKKDGTASVITTDDNTATGKTLIMTLSPTKGFMLTTPWGGISLGPNGFQAYTQDGATYKGSIEVRNDGTCVTVGKAYQCQCSQVTLGIVPPGAVTNTCLYGVTGVAGVASTSVFIAT